MLGGAPQRGRRLMCPNLMWRTERGGPLPNNYSPTPAAKTTTLNLTSRMVRAFFVSSGANVWLDPALTARGRCHF